MLAIEGALTIDVLAIEGTLTIGALAIEGTLTIDLQTPSHVYYMGWPGQSGFSVCPFKQGAVKSCTNTFLSLLGVSHRGRPDYRYAS